MAPIAESDGSDPCGCREDVPGVAASVDDVVVGIVDADGEVVVADIFPDVYDGIQFGRVAQQAEQGNVVEDDKKPGR